jgi:adenylate kinase family enzyme
MKNPLIVFLIGPNGSGKGHLCQKIIPLIEVQYRIISISDLLRKIELPEEEVTAMDQGRLVSDRFVLEIMDDYFSDTEIFKTPLVLVDGFPRNLFQAEYVVENFDPKKAAVIRMESDQIVCFNAVKSRIESGHNRPDDTPPVFCERWGQYEDEVLPAIRRMEEEFSVYTIPGGIHVGEGIQLAPIVRMCDKFGIETSCDDSFLIDEICRKIPDPSPEFPHLLNTHPEILVECPEVEFRIA